MHKRGIFSAVFLLLGRIHHHGYLLAYRCIIAACAFTALCACTVARMDAHGLTPNSNNFSSGSFGAPQDPSSGAVVHEATEFFSGALSQKAVDILFVDDNSNSMEARQSSLGAKFSAFASALQGLNWQVGITTTDCSNDAWGICGSLLPMTGGSGTILTANTPGFATVFNNTIVRPETVNCLSRGICPSGNSEPLKAAITSFDKRKTSNAGFFRDGASLAVVILTNATEQNQGGPSATTPQNVVDHFDDIWGATKQLKVYAIDIVPGDGACLARDSELTAGESFYGIAPSTLAWLTGGVSESICAPDYASLLGQIGGDLTELPNSFALAHAPLPGSVVVTLIGGPDEEVRWTISGNILTLSTSLPVNAQLTISYSYK